MMQIFYNGKGNNVFAKLRIENVYLRIDFKL